MKYYDDHIEYVRATLILTYFTPWSRVLLEKLTSKLCSYSRNSPHLWNPKVPHRTHKWPPSVPILSQPHPAPTTPSNFLKIHLNIILPSKSWSPQWTLSLRLPHQHPVQRDCFTFSMWTRPRGERTWNKTADYVLSYICEVKINNQIVS